MATKHSIRQATSLLKGQEGHWNEIKAGLQSIQNDLQSTSERFRILLNWSLQLFLAMQELSRKFDRDVIERQVPRVYVLPAIVMTRVLLAVAGASVANPALRTALTVLLGTDASAAPIRSSHSGNGRTGVDLGLWLSAVSISIERARYDMSVNQRPLTDASMMNTLQPLLENAQTFENQLDVVSDRLGEISLDDTLVKIKELVEMLGGTVTLEARLKPLKDLITVETRDELWQQTTAQYKKLVKLYAECSEKVVSIQALLKETRRLAALMAEMAESIRRDVQQFDGSIFDMQLHPPASPLPKSLPPLPPVESKGRTTSLLSPSAAAFEHIRREIEKTSRRLTEDADSLQEENARLTREMKFTRDHVNQMVMDLAQWLTDRENEALATKPSARHIAQHALWGMVPWGLRSPVENVGAAISRAMSPTPR
ncbi:hypothetical protein SmJEL517_g04852 [Synchytrium microbalum]|uniref:Uncharacterized protein n=1 Tax=Synchytrium microbalum TaxID=1806994 RepID=A0A507BPN1_9FUNG|nr:uncharacterized protein SmJEL517_g04852 [Synchytrium microbalum]TPX31910.1 hypothetical protein SmJEL517_g04852 [Synchytrium microbalum]